MENRGLLERTPYPKIIIAILVFVAAGIIIKLVNKPTFEIYIVTPESVKAAKSANGSMKLEQLALDGKAIFTDKDIKSYDWKNHRIVLNEEFIKKQKKFNNSLAQYNGVDYLVVVNGERMYTGYFQSGGIRTSYIRSSTKMYIIDSNLIDISGDSQYIENIKIYKALKSTGKLME